jgi:hypothetical protein
MLYIALTEKPLCESCSWAFSSAAQVTNQVTVSGGGSASAIAADPTTIGPSAGHPSFFKGEDYVGSGVYYL